MKPWVELYLELIRRGLVDEVPQEDGPIFMVGQYFSMACGVCNMSLNTASGSVVYAHFERKHSEILAAMSLASL